MKFLRFISALLLLLIVKPGASCAQASGWDIDPNVNGWFSYVGKYRLHDRFGLYNELHFRRTHVVTGWQQYLFRPGFDYFANPNLKLTVGMTVIRSHPYGKWPAPRVIPEQNVWVQALLKQKVKRLTISHRYRLEERWIGVAHATGNEVLIAGYAHASRFRYRLTFKVPLGKVSGKNRLALTVFSESWLNLNAWHLPVSFNQHWFSATLGYALSKDIGLQIGALHQWLFRGNGNRFESNPTLLAGFSWAPDFRRKG
ncbi:MAG TPA: DUF2490 domain-containing protein [Bacteroidetes bacterium]|nr:DUF2490 domain-containing protein [Bacteroidota bacterium]